MEKARVVIQYLQVELVGDNERFLCELDSLQYPFEFFSILDLSAPISPLHDFQCTWKIDTSMSNG